MEISKSLLDPGLLSRGIAKHGIRRAMNFGEFVNGKAPQRLPPALQSDEHAISSFQWHCHQLCVKLLHLFALGLKVKMPVRVIYNSATAKAEADSVE